MNFGVETPDSALEGRYFALETVCIAVGDGARAVQTVYIAMKALFNAMGRPGPGEGVRRQGG